MYRNCSIPKWIILIINSIIFLRNESLPLNFTCIHVLFIGFNPATNIILYIISYKIYILFKKFSSLNNVENILPFLLIFQKLSKPISRNILSNNNLYVSHILYRRLKETIRLFEISARRENCLRVLTENIWILINPPSI